MKFFPKCYKKSKGAVFVIPKMYNILLKKSTLLTIYIENNAKQCQ